jgi:putative endonuclease
MKAPAVYILASQRNGTLYIGVTSDLVQRIWQHREGVVEGFTKQYGVKTLVWYEQHEIMESAISREKALKKWNRDWKLRLIEERNPEWRDLWLEITGQEQSLEKDRHSSEAMPGQVRETPPRHSREAAPRDPAETFPRHSHETPPRRSREGGNPEALIVQSTTNLNGATRNEQPGFPPKARGNDGSRGGGL